MWGSGAILRITLAASCLLFCCAGRTADTGGGSGRPGEVITVELNGTHLEKLRTGGQGWLVVCGYQEPGRGIWSGTLAETQSLVLVPLTRTKDGVVDCQKNSWAYGYDELGVVKKHDTTAKEEEKKVKNTDPHHLCDKEKNTTPTDPGDNTYLEVLYQSVSNLLFFCLLPLLTRLGLLGHRVQNLYWRMHQHPRPQQNSPPSRSQPLPSHTDNNEYEDPDNEDLDLDWDDVESQRGAAAQGVAGNRGEAGGLGRGRGRARLQHTSD